MTIRPTPFAPFLLLWLAGCGDHAGSGAANNAAAAAPGDYIARMQQLNEKERAAVLFRAIRDAGRACQGVVRSAPVAGAAGAADRPAWVATCDDGGQWLVTLGDDGIATVTGAR